MESAITIRDAQPDDLPSILEIEKLCFKEDSFTKSQFIYLMTRGKGAFFILQAGTRTIAYLSVSFNSRTHNLRIYSIAVHPGCQGMQLGQLLMDKAIEYAEGCNARKMTLEVKTTNNPAIGLYKKNGFEMSYIKPNYYHDGSDAYYMTKPIGKEI